MRRATILGLVAMALSVVPTEAGAMSCVIAGDTMTLTVVDGDRVRVFRDGPQLRATESGSGCTASASSLNTVQVNDSSPEGDVRVTLDLSRGPFGPGLTPEASGVSEIEVHINFKPGSLIQQLTIIGSEGRDRFDVGGHGAGGNLANLNADDDNDDISMGNVDLLTIRTLGGRDTIDADGVPGFDIPYIGPLRVLSGAGSDIVRAGRGVLTARTSSGNDQVLGGPARDRISGGAGADRIKGQGRGDTLNGNLGNDSLSGGPGLDTCRGGPGDDRLFSCERP
jgi:Ca2+-binding RTX toxin-like protein